MERWPFQPARATFADLPTRLADGLGLESAPVLRPAPRGSPLRSEWVPRTDSLRSRFWLLAHNPTHSQGKSQIARCKYRCQLLLGAQVANIALNHHVCRRCPFGSRGTLGTFAKTRGFSRRCPRCPFGSRGTLGTFA